MLRVVSRGPWSVSLDGAAMFKVSNESAICVGRLSFGCDNRELGHVGRFGVVARLGARDGSGLYALASVGAWRSSWATGEVLGVTQSTDRTSGAVADVGVGAPLPLGDRRTGIELRYGRFDGVTASTYGFLGSGNSLRLSITRRW
jgi:hypothetical protein